MEVLAGDIAHLERDGRVRRGRPADRVGRAQIHLLAGHRFDQAILRQVGDRRGDDVPRVAEHRHLLADFVNLLQMMRDEEERHALPLQLAHPDEQPLDLVAVELRGRLVEDDEAGAVRERAGDFDELARLDLEVAGAHVLGHRDVPLVENFARLAAQRAPADQAATRRLAVDQQVLADREVGNDGRMLIDAGDLSTPGFPVGNRRRRLAGKTNLAAVGLAQAREDSDQRRLSSAVAADQRMRFARHDADTGLAQRKGRAVALADPDRLDDRQNAGRARIAAPAQHRRIGHETFDAAF